MATYKKLQVTTKSTDFRIATEIFNVYIPKPGPGQVLIKNHFAGVNATDINVSAARYFTDGKVPFDIGFEGLGEVDAVGEGVENFKVGQAVMSMTGSGYAEYLVSYISYNSTVNSKLFANKLPHWKCLSHKVYTYFSVIGISEFENAIFVE